MTDRRWKANERAIAKALGGERVPITGRKGADIRHEWLAPEVKSRQEIPAWLKKAMSQAKAAAEADQLPVVVLHEVGARHVADLLVMTLGDFRQWFGDIETGGGLHSAAEVGTIPLASEQTSD